MEARRARRRARACCASSRRSRASTCPRCTTSSTTARASARSRPRYPDVPARRRQAHGRRPRRVAVPEAAARAAHRGRARPPQRRDLPRLHARLPLLPGRDDHAARCASAPPTRCARWCEDGLRRTGYDEVALTSLSSADFSGIDGLVADLVNEQEGCGNVGALAAVAARRRVHRRHRERDPEGAPHRAHVRARRRARGGSAR